jgi:hypothetical protein
MALQQSLLIRLTSDAPHAEKINEWLVKTANLKVMLVDIYNANANKKGYLL